MDVNMTTVGKEGEGRPKELTLEENQKRLREGRCFVCGSLGHMSRVCPNKGNEGNGKVGRTERARAMMVEGGQQEERQEKEGDEQGNPPPYDPATMMSHIRAMSMEERDGFLDSLMMAEEDF